MTDIDKLLSIMRTLRDPEKGCPWDLQQDFTTIAPYTIEEAYEVQDAIIQKDYANLCQELGDLLLQVVFHAQMAEEAELFSFQDVVDAISNKMTRRHPHVFANKTYASIEEQHADWERIKREEKASTEDLESILDKVPIAQPALKRAQDIQRKAASVGFDWKDWPPVMEKLEEEIEELKQALVSEQQGAIEEELGDVLFSLVNLGRKLQIDNEYALHCCNQKFIRRFQFIEQQLSKQGLSFDSVTLDQLEQFWQQAKRNEVENTIAD